LVQFLVRGGALANSQHEKIRRGGTPEAIPLFWGL